MMYIDSVYGQQELEFDALRIVSTPGFLRLRDIHQNGSVFLVNPLIKTTRYDHSLGVYLLLKKLNAPLPEQIAGLLHDVSHTVFSHVADTVFQHSDENYHELQFKNYLETSGIANEIRSFYEDVVNVRSHPLLEREVPMLCADRIDYCLRDCLAFGLADSSFIHELVDGLLVEDESIVCKDLKTAQKLADLFLKLNSSVFFKEEYEVANLLLADLLKRAIADGILCEDDFMKTETFILERISKSHLQERLEKIKNKQFSFKKSERGQYFTTRKFRVADPLIFGTGKTLTQHDPHYKEKLEQFMKNPRLATYDIEVA